MHLMSFRIIFITVLVLAALSISSCDRDVCCEDGAYTFSGFVTDSISNLAVDSACITLDKTGQCPYFTDTNGFYKGGNFPGVITIFVKKSSYYTQSRQISLTSDLTQANFKIVPDTL